MIPEEIQQALENIGPPPLTGKEEIPILASSLSAQPAHGRWPYILACGIMGLVLAFTVIDLQFTVIDLQTSQETTESSGKDFMQIKTDFDSVYNSFNDLLHLTKDTQQKLQGQYQLNDCLQRRHATDQREILRLHHAIDKLQCAYEKATDGEEHLCDKELNTVHQ